MIPSAGVVCRGRLPGRMHHHAYVTRDMAATRMFYEHLIGLPLVATWCECDVLFGKRRTYCHCFFALGDDSALTFFQFADEKDWHEFGEDRPASPFIHIALETDAPTQQAIENRLTEAGYGAPAMYVIDHGYCRSVYVVDPNGLIVEFTCDHPNAEAIRRTPAVDCRSRPGTVAGDRRSNNAYRSDS